MLEARAASLVSPSLRSTIAMIATRTPAQPSFPTNSVAEGLKTAEHTQRSETLNQRRYTKRIISIYLRHIIAVSLALAWWAAPANAELIFINDQTVESHVDLLRSQVIPRDSQRYLPPSAQERAAFRNLADGIWNAGSVSDLNALVPLAETLDYDVISLSSGGSTYFGLQESNIGVDRKGWGSFLVRQGASSSALVQVPHPLADINTPAIGAQSFVGSDARGFLIAGAHRNANGQDTADVAHLSESIFQEVHQSFVENAPNLSVWQIHGFDIDQHAEFPAGIDAVISSGTGSVTELLLGLDQRIDALEGSWTSHVYNTLNINDPLNIAVNENVAGSVFRSLAGTTNVQQQHTTALGGQFLHIELEQSFRIDGGDFARQLISQTIADAISSSATAIPEPSFLIMVGLIVGCYMTGRRRSV